MRHGKKIHKLERPKAHREALISNMAQALITHRRIKTTESKAKALKPVIDKLVTTAKENTVSARRLAAKTIKSKELLKKLFDEIAPEMMDRTSGYSRIMRIGVRQGDGAELVLIELISASQVDEDETAKKGKSKKVKATKKAAPAAKMAKAETAETQETEPESKDSEVQSEESSSGDEPEDSDKKAES